MNVRCAMTRLDRIRNGNIFDVHDRYDGELKNTSGDVHKKITDPNSVTVRAKWTRVWRRAMAGADFSIS